MRKQILWDILTRLNNHSETLEAAAKILKGHNDCIEQLQRQMDAVWDQLDKGEE